MTNIQQPEMRRSGHDPLVQDHREETAQKGAPSGKGPKGKIPPDQDSPYGRAPNPEAELEGYEDRPRRTKR
jgi:hypothetical protein